MTQTPTLTQVQIIQSLAEALSWMEKELSWGVALGELNHLTGRIGELYAAMITRGQMALATNQQGYDVVSAANERISVKCVTSSAQVNFNQNTFHLVDRIIVLRIVNERALPSRSCSIAQPRKLKAECGPAARKLFSRLLRQHAQKNHWIIWQ